MSAAAGAAEGELESFRMSLCTSISAILRITPRFRIASVSGLVVQRVPIPHLRFMVVGVWHCRTYFARSPQDDENRPHFTDSMGVPA